MTRRFLIVAALLLAGLLPASSAWGNGMDEIKESIDAIAAAERADEEMAAIRRFRRAIADGEASLKVVVIAPDGGRSNFAQAATVDEGSRITIEVTEGDVHFVPEPWDPVDLVNYRAIYRE